MFPPGYLETAAIIASLDRRRRLYRDVGWLYVLRNPAFREPILKIGKSSRPPTARAAELGAATGVPSDFQLLYFVHVGDHHAAEGAVHTALTEHRTARNKEFFAVPVLTAVTALDQAAEMFPVLMEQGGRLATIPQCLGAQVISCPGCGRATRLRRLAVSTITRCANCKHQFPV